VEGLVDVVKHVVNVLLHDAGLVVVNGSDISLDDIGIRGAEEVRAAVAHRSGVDDVVAMLVIGSRADGVSAANIGGDVSHDGQPGG